MAFNEESSLNSDAMVHSDGHRACKLAWWRNTLRHQEAQLLLEFSGGPIAHLDLLRRIRVSSHIITSMEREAWGRHTHNIPRAFVVEAVEVVFDYTAETTATCEAAEACDGARAMDHTPHAIERWEWEFEEAEAMHPDAGVEECHHRRLRVLYLREQQQEEGGDVWALDATRNEIAYIKSGFDYCAADRRRRRMNAALQATKDESLQREEDDRREEMDKLADLNEQWLEELIRHGAGVGAHPPSPDAQPGGEAANWSRWEDDRAWLDRLLNSATGLDDELSHDDLDMPLEYPNPSSPENSYFWEEEC